MRIMEKTIKLGLCKRHNIQGVEEYILERRYYEIIEKSSNKI